MSKAEHSLTNFLNGVALGISIAALIVIIYNPMPVHQFKQQIERGELGYDKETKTWVKLKDKKN